MKARGRFMLGMVLGLLPCGMVMAALMAASTAPDVRTAVFAIMAFGAGTMPSLVAVAIAGKEVSLRFPERMKTIRRGLMLWSGLWLLIMAGLMVMRG